jgi:hypothetical protein
LPDTLDSSKEMTNNSIFHHSAPRVYLQWVMLMLSNIMRIFTSPYMTVVPVDCSTDMKCCFIRKTPQSVETGLILSIVGKRWPWTMRMKSGSYHTKWSNSQYNVIFHFGNRMFYFIAIG